MASRQQHWAELDGLRGILALGIVVFHYGFNSLAMRVAGWRGIEFELAVDVFFLLSGFVLCHSTRAGIYLPRFAWKRFCRLAPTFYATTLMIVLLDPSSASFLELALAAPLLGQQPANFPSWSITWELYLPVAAATLPFAIGDRFVKPALVIALFGMGCAATIEMSGTPFTFPRAVFGLASGYLLYRSGITINVPLMPVYGAIAIVMAMASYLPASTMFLPVFASMAILAGRENCTVLSNRPGQFLGAISYTLYLVHIPVLTAFLRFTPAVISEHPAGKLLVVVIATGAAYILTVCIERPFMLRSRRPPNRA